MRGCGGGECGGGGGGGGGGALVARVWKVRGSLALRSVVHRAPCGTHRLHGGPREVRAARRHRRRHAHLRHRSQVSSVPSAAFTGTPVAVAVHHKHSEN
jgi:hypothetical protein